MYRRLIILLTIAVMALCGCRVNNGDIGDYFGAWLLYSMTVDGEVPEDFNPEQTYWEFQNNIVQISRVSYMFEKKGRWGTWSEDDNTLLLNFTHYQEGYEPGSAQYRAPEWLGFPQNSIIPLTFVSRSSKRMELTWRDVEGKIYVYSLRKLW